MKAFEFKGLLGIATILLGFIGIIYNDKLAGTGLLTAGLALVVDAGHDAVTPIGNA